MEVALFIVAYGVGALLPDWRWWAGYALVTAAAVAVLAWGLISGSHSTLLMLAVLVLPAIAGAFAGVLVRAVTLALPRLSSRTQQWILLAGLVLTGAAAAYLL